MAKKSVKKKSSSSSKKSSSSSSKKSSSSENVNKILIENLVSLQKVLTNLSVKFDSLTKRLDGMIDLFEESAKTVVKGEVNAMEDSKHTKKVLEKMDKLFDQNKLIARGLTLMSDSNSKISMQKDSPVDNDSEDFDASPSVKSSSYAMPYANSNSSNSVPAPSQNRSGKTNFQQKSNTGPQGNSQNFNGNQNNRGFPGRNDFSQKGSSSFSPPKPSKVVREEDSEENSEENIPKSPPFSNF
jgi:hypothetical protein